MTKTLLFLVLAIWASAAQAEPKLSRLTFDYPHGCDRLTLFADGRALLYYGALPQKRSLVEGTFRMEEIQRQLQPHLKPNVPREQWPNPQAATYGMVKFDYSDGSSKDFLIFERDDWAKQIFTKAKASTKP